MKKLKRGCCLILMATVITCMMGCSSKKTSNNNGNANAAQTQTQNNLKSFYVVGENFQYNGMEIEYAESGEFKNAEVGENEKCIFLRLAFINNGLADHMIYESDFNAYADGNLCKEKYNEDGILSAKLSCGSQIMTKMGFIVPKDAKSVVIEYWPDKNTSEKIRFSYEGLKNTQYVIQNHMERTDWSYQVGDAIDVDYARINYLSCEDYTSYSSTEQPAEGYHYVSLELQYENTSDATKKINSKLKFKCYADCMSCNQVSVRDDEFNDTEVPAKGIAKGTVTFEVPDDAEVIEVEYFDEIWTTAVVIMNVK